MFYWCYFTVTLLREVNLGSARLAQQIPDVQCISFLFPDHVDGVAGNSFGYGWMEIFYSYKKVLIAIYSSSLFLFNSLLFRSSLALKSDNLKCVLCDHPSSSVIRFQTDIPKPKDTGKKGNSDQHRSE